LPTGARIAKVEEKGSKPEIAGRNQEQTGINADETLDAIMGGKLRIIQKERGYRFSMDAILLARSVMTRKNDRIIDLGTGCGIIPLIIASQGDFKSITGVEIQKELADLAIRNVQLNGKTHDIEIVELDIKDISSCFKRESFDVAVSNPPFGKPGSGRVNPNSQRAIARHELTLTLETLIDTVLYALKKGGRFYLIYPTPRLARLIFFLKKKGLEPKTMRMVHTRMEDDAQLVIIECLKGGGEELRITPPLYLYGPDGAYTEETARLYTF